MKQVSSDKATKAGTHFCAERGKAKNHCALGLDVNVGLLVAHGPGKPPARGVALLHEAAQLLTRRAVVLPTDGRFGIHEGYQRWP